MFFFNELSQFLAIVSQPTVLILLPLQNNSGATSHAIAPKLLTLSAIPTLLELLTSHSFLINPVKHFITPLPVHINTRPVDYSVNSFIPVKYSISPRLNTFDNTSVEYPARLPAFSPRSFITPNICSVFSWINSSP